MADDQETYLANTPLKDICIRGIKKLVTEVSSVKSLAMLAFVGLNFFGKMDSYATVVGLLGCIGAKEVDFTQIIEIVKSRVGGGK